MACSMAFFWADEPSPFSLPVPQSAVLALPLALEEPLEEAVVLLLEPQPARASVPTRATPVTLVIRRRDWIFTIWSLSTAGKMRSASVPAAMRIWRQNDALLGGR